MNGSGAHPTPGGLTTRVRAAIEARRDRRALEFARRDRGEPGPVRAADSSTSSRESVSVPHPRRRNAAMAGATAAALVLLLVLFLGPGSFRVWSAQRAQTRQLDDKVATLDQANAALAARAKELRDPEAITELARRDYGMVPKGSKAFAILPPAVPDVRPSGSWPFVELQSSGSSATAQEPSATTP